jgi:hypothetical protein
VFSNSRGMDMGKHFNFPSKDFIGLWCPTNDVGSQSTFVDIDIIDEDLEPCPY